MANSNFLFEHIINSSEIKLQKLSEYDTTLKTHPNKWSKKEILGHLIDSAFVNHNRFVSSQLKDNLIFDTYDQDEWVRLHKYNDQPWNELIKLWKMLNLQIWEVVKNIHEENLTKLISVHNFDKICFKLVEKNQKSSLEYLINDYILHLEHHLNSIFNQK